jgi:hypothetical protein
MNAHKENLNPFFQQKKGIPECRTRFYIEKFLLKHCTFAIIHATLRKLNVNGYGSRFSGWNKMISGPLNMQNGFSHT